MDSEPGPSSAPQGGSCPPPLGSPARSSTPVSAVEDTSVTSATSGTTSTANLINLHGELLAKLNRPYVVQERDSFADWVRTCVHQFTAPRFRQCQREITQVIHRLQEAQEREAALQDRPGPSRAVQGQVEPLAQLAQPQVQSQLPPLPPVPLDFSRGLFMSHQTMPQSPPVQRPPRPSSSPGRVTGFSTSSPGLSQMDPSPATLQNVVWSSYGPSPPGPSRVTGDDSQSQTPSQLHGLSGISGLSQMSPGLIASAQEVLDEIAHSQPKT